MRRYQNRPSFTMHEMSFWRDRAKYSKDPLWQRVAWLCYGSQAQNGHAMFRDGEIAKLLGGVDNSNDTLGRALRRAVNEFMLDERSTLNCLIAPPGICGGDGGRQNSPCAIHDGLVRKDAYKRAGASRRPATPNPPERQPQGELDGVTVPVNEERAITDLDSCRDCDRPARINGLCVEHDRARCENSWNKTPVGV